MDVTWLRDNAGEFVTAQVKQRAQRAAAQRHAKQANVPKYGHVVINLTDGANTESGKVC